MKPLNPVIPDYRSKEERNKKEEVTLTFKPCCVCNATISAGYYGVWHDGGTCSRKCDALRQDMQLYLREVP